MSLNQAKGLLTAFLLSSSCSVLFAQTPVEKQEIVKEYDQQTLRSLEAQFLKESTDSKKRALQLASINNWPILIDLPNGEYAELQGVDQDDNPIYYTTENVAAAKSTRTNHLNSGGSTGYNLNGNNITAYVWDGGTARITHQEYDGAGGTNRYSVGDATTSTHYHAAHVTGTIMASGVQPNAKGMAPYSDVRGYDWNSDLSEATSAAAGGMLVSNHSYGYRVRDDLGNPILPSYYFGGYIGVSRSWDQIAYNAPYYLMVVAAGNEGNDNSANSSPLAGNSAYDKLNGHSTAKNNLVVANAQDANIDANGNLISVTINSSSSEGPTDDLRIKPDITGNGTSLYSTYDGSDSQYGTLTGTSMASPNVTGSLVLLQEHYKNVTGGFMKASTLKGLVLHTADDAGSTGPDAIYGWGLMNAKKAAETISQNGTNSIVQELTLSSGNSYSITVDSDGLNNLLASISWTDVAGTANTGTVNLSTPVLVNDLDIRITKNTTIYTPWRLTGVTTNGKGDNTVDPYERVDVTNASGSYTITVTHKGSLSSGSQNFSLIVTGITQNAQVCTATVPAGISISGITSSSANALWNDVTLATYSYRYRVQGASAWTTSTTANESASMTGLQASTNYEFQVRSECAGGTTSAYSASTVFTTTGAATFCSTTITSFPYSESFENTLGSWTQNTDDDFNWTIQSGGTPSSNTGPAAASNGSYYIYMESSSPNYSAKNAKVTSPCFNLSGIANPTIKFDYHMYGTSAMGQLNLQASTNGTTWTTIWNKSGNQGNNWTTETINLSSYANATVKFRFNGTTGTTWQGDMAVDALSIQNATPSCTDVNLTITFDNYPEETSWEIRNSANTLVSSGGTYPSQPDGSTLNTPLCLTPGCYTLTVNDSYGDGMCCAYGNGSYALSLANGGTVLAQGGQFTTSQVTSFCVGSGFAMQSTSDSQEGSLEKGTFISLYPNPVEGMLTIEHNLTNDVSYELVDVNGSTIRSGNLVGSTIDLSSISKGVYFLNVKEGTKTSIHKVVKN